eukprot:Skav222622  [mRNA]  locus=scaffold4205:86469:93548:+ [translate_table: standard]
MEGKTGETQVRRFSGDVTDPQRAYKQWKRWSRMYLVVQKARGVSETALGAMLYTLLDGSALQAFDSINLDELEQAGGPDVVYGILDDRFPEAASHDRVGEVLDAIFDLKVDRNESTAAYTGKVKAAFNAAEQEGIKFPPIAKGYLMLRFARLSPERRAVVMAAARQSYLENDISAALRTTYPEGLGTHRSSAVAQVATEAEPMEEPYDPVDEEDILLAKDEDDNDFGEGPLEEQDVIEALMTWKQTRATISKEKLARGLASGKDMKKIEARVRCYRCKQVGHFSRDCPVKKKNAPASSASKVSFVNMALSSCQPNKAGKVNSLVREWEQQPRDYWKVEQDRVIRVHVLPRFNLYAPLGNSCPVPLTDLSSARKTTILRPDGTQEEVFSPNWRNKLEAHRDAPPGPWTGQTEFFKMVCHGEDADAEDDQVESLIAAFYAEHAHQEDDGVPVPEQDCNNVFLNEEPESDDEEDGPDTLVSLVHDAGLGVVDTGCGRGLVGEETLLRHEVQLKKHQLSITELDARPHTFRYGNGSADRSHRRVELPIFIQGKPMRMRLHVVPGNVPLLVSKRFLKSLGAKIGLEGNDLILKKAGVVAPMKELRDGSYQINLLEVGSTSTLASPEVDVLDSSASAAYMTVDDAVDLEEELGCLAGETCVFKAQERKALQAELTQVLASHAQHQPSVIEVFSPARFEEHCQRFGLASRGSFDFSDGWDWTKVKQRRRAEEIIRMVDPDLLTLSPPCGALCALQRMVPMSKRRDPEQFLKEVKEAEDMVFWCCRRAKEQLKRGKHYLLEASQGSDTWKQPEVESLRQAGWHIQVDVPACSVGLRDRESKLLFGKKWRFVTSSPAIGEALLRLKCSGDHQHQVVEGSSGGQLRSIQSQVYPKRLIHIILGAFAREEHQTSVCMPISQATLQTDEPKETANRRKLENAIRKLHVNLGHASGEDMHRILKHHGAQAPVLELVKAFSCDLCKSRQAPKATRDSAPPKDITPLRYVGLDVKWLPGWKKGEKIKALNMVCCSSGLQQMFPFREQESSELVARLYRNWTKAFGRPRFLKMDAGRCNLGQFFMDMLERDGTTPLDIPGEAHHQIGNVESAGRHFEEALIRVIDEIGPSTYPEWCECVDMTIESRNMLMRKGGYSPNQLVFGRDPECPGDDVLCDEANPIANSAILEDAVAQFSHQVRQSARMAVLATMDHKAARIALNSRPRPERLFQPGDQVAIWRREVGPSDRTQKHFIDLTHEDLPPGDLLKPDTSHLPDCRPGEQVDTAMAPILEDGYRSNNSVQELSSAQTLSSGSTLGEQLSQLSNRERRLWPESVEAAERLDGLSSVRRPSNTPLPSSGAASKKQKLDESQSVAGQQFPPSLPPPPHSSPQTVSSEHVSTPERASHHGSERASHHSSDDLLVHDCSHACVCFSVMTDGVEEDEDFVLWADATHALLAGGRKEIDPRAAEFTTGKGAELLLKGLRKEANNIIHDKQALRPLSLEESRRIRQQQGHRVVPSRMVLTRKIGDAGEEVIKARWTARGDKDPDLFHLVRDGRTQAPTISSNGRFTVLQTIASNQFHLQLGDVTGAFLESDALVRDSGPLFMSGPSNVGLPDYDPEILYEVIRPIYGLNDSPQKWFLKFESTVKSQKWIQSQLDRCVFYLWEGSTLQGVMGVHVDDVVIGGRGPLFDKSLAELRASFPFRKWQIGKGTFCGADLTQDEHTFGITVSQTSFAEKLQKPDIRWKANPLYEATDKEVSSVKSTLGGALWLAKETRPDLAVQVSVGQQLLPRPTVGQAKTVANVVRRAKQYKDLVWKILPIPMLDLRMCLHSDAAFANTKKQGTQGGYLVGITDDQFRRGKPAPWSPAAWKSYRLKRVVGSTFAAETQVLSDGLGHAEWLACHLAEAKHRNFQVKDREKFLPEFQLQAVVDCKSIYDHLQSFASPGSISDKRVAIDVVIVRENLDRLGGCIRWVPTHIQLADALTKENPDAMDILRAALVTNRYHMHEESMNMEAAAEQRSRRLARQPAASEPQVSQGSAVFAVFSKRCSAPMVKVPVKNLSETELRAMFEVMVSNTVKNAAEFEANLTQTKSMCKARIPASQVNERLFRGEDAKITFTYTVATRMITVQGGATFVDGAEETLKMVLDGYASAMQDKKIPPLADGARVWGQAIKYLCEQGTMSDYMEYQKDKDQPEKAEIKIIPHTPDEAEFVAAVADLCNEGARKLHNYPGWRNKFLQYMLKEFGADTDQILELSQLQSQFECLKEEDESAWAMPEDEGMKTACKAKAAPKPIGYRSSLGYNIEQKF